MSERMVSLTIQGLPVTVPEGTLLVDAAKRAGIYIPVFCYHPKLEPVGMCRMCLVEIGRPKRDRQTGELIRDESGQPLIEFGPKLETACTTPVEEGWVVHTTSAKSLQGQKQIVEFLLTSHPLDCPVCDKGGECPLQELSMDFGSGKSRFVYDDKMHLSKHVPLGELVYLDRERCIQCGRCVRFQEEIADDPVIGFEQRGRSLQIVTYSTPGFNSYFSGNTTDICPVGALTTADFRFEARAWELNTSATICPHCPVGCNLAVDTRRQPDQGGQVTVQRVMPRHNEAVNEIWICDKGRFAHHSTRHPGRLTSPMVRRDGRLVEASWDEALAEAAAGLDTARGRLVGLAGGRATNEDMFAFRKLIEGLEGGAFLADGMGGGDWAQRTAPGRDSSLRALGSSDVILVAASDLHEEAPIWWLRVKQAVDRGAKLILVNARRTRLDKHAHVVLECGTGKQASQVEALSKALSNPGQAAKGLKPAAEALAQAEHLIVFFGQEGLSAADSQVLAQACADLLAASGRAGQTHSGVIPVWPHANTQGAWDIGLRPASSNLDDLLAGSGAVYVMATDPAADHPNADHVLKDVPFLIVQDLFLTETGQLANVVFPAQAFLEREGTYTSGERRVQRFYKVLPSLPGTRPDWDIVSSIGRALGLTFVARHPATVFVELAASTPDYAGLTYAALSGFENQWPPVGGDDLYFGGTAHPNQQGIGIQLGPTEKSGQPDRRTKSAKRAPAGADEQILLVPVTRLFDRALSVTSTQLLSGRLQPRQMEIHPDDAARFHLEHGATAEFKLGETPYRLNVSIHADVPKGSALLPRSIGVPLEEPMWVRLQPAGERQRA